MFYLLFSLKIKFESLFKISLALMLMASIMVLITFKSSDANFFELLIGYINEPWNNFILLVQSFDHNFTSTFNGQLLFENNITSRIPRFFYPDKPYLSFGGYRLGMQYYSDNIALGIGSPSFGSEGIVYADWGVSGLILLLIYKYACFLILGRLVSKIQKIPYQYSFIYFGLILIFSDFNFLVLPPASTLIDNIILIIIISLVIGVKFKKTPKTFVT